MKFAIMADEFKNVCVTAQKAGLNALEGVSICAGEETAGYRSTGGRCCFEKIQINGDYHILSASRAGATRRHARPLKDA